MAVVYKKPDTILRPMSWCPGCGHGVITRMIMECLDELSLVDKTISVVDIGCSYWEADGCDLEFIAGPHGRCAAVATAVKKVRPNSFVYVHAGDGCSYSIGLTETFYAALRDIPISMIVVNNGVFGMTGGQMCPATTLLGDKTVSTKAGRDVLQAGHPVDMLEVLKPCNVEFLARGTVTDPKAVEQTKRYIKKAFENQINKKGFSLVEIISPCPTNCHLSPVDSMKKIKNECEKVFPLGVFADRGGHQ